MGLPGAARCEAATTSAHQGDDAGHQGRPGGGVEGQAAERQREASVVETSLAYDVRGAAVPLGGGGASGVGRGLGEDVCPQ